MQYLLQAHSPISYLLALLAYICSCTVVCRFNKPTCGTRGGAAARVVWQRCLPAWASNQNVQITYFLKRTSGCKSLNPWLSIQDHCQQQHATMMRSTQRHWHAQPQTCKYHIYHLPANCSDLGWSVGFGGLGRPELPGEDLEVKKWDSQGLTPSFLVVV